MHARFFVGSNSSPNCNISLAVPLTRLHGKRTGSNLRLGIGISSVATNVEGEIVMRAFDETYYETYYRLSRKNLYAIVLLAFFLGAVSVGVIDLINS